MRSYTIVNLHDRCFEPQIATTLLSAVMPLYAFSGHHIRGLRMKPTMIELCVTSKDAQSLLETALRVLKTAAEWTSVGTLAVSKP